MQIRGVIIGGIVASLVLGMWQMLVEAILPDGAGFFGPVVAIGATLVRDLQGSANPIPFDAAAFGLGLAGHMMNSVILAVIFGLVARRLVHGRGALVILGAAYGAVVWVAMWYVVLPVIDPLMLNVNGVAFLLGHLMWGAALGFLWSLVSTAPAAEAGSASAAHGGSAPTGV